MPPKHPTTPRSRCRRGRRLSFTAVTAMLLLSPLGLACGDDTVGPETDGESESESESGDTESAAAPCVAELAPGSLVITEIMANPTGADSGLEWIELHNPGAQPVPLDGVRLVTSKANGDSEDSHSISGLEIAPGGFVTLGNLPDPEMFSFIDYGYGDSLGDLTNTAGVVRLMCGEAELDAVIYESEKDGASYSFNGALTPDAEANDDKTEWCRATSRTENFQTGDEGTPGQPNGYCPPPEGECYEGASRRAINPPGPGDIVISEFMANPQGADSGQEWLELQVLTAIDLNNLELGKQFDDVEQTFFSVDDVDVTAAPGEQFQCTSVAADTTLLLAQGDDPETNGGLPTPDLLLKSSLSLNNSDSGLFISYGGALIDEIQYTSTSEGEATALAPESMSADANDEADPTASEESAWCLATAPYGSGGAGTPGARNPKCGQCLDSQSQMMRDPKPPGPGDLVITEFMANPEGTDGGNEWFEVYVNADVDLAGLHVGKKLDGLEALENPGGTCMAVTAGTYLLFGQTEGEEVDHLFDFALSNSGENALYLQARDVLVDEVFYAASQAENTAASLGQSPPDASANDDADAAPWCAVAGGTPRAANPACP